MIYILIFEKKALEAQAECYVVESCDKRAKTGIREKGMIQRTKHYRKAKQKGTSKRIQRRTQEEEKDGSNHRINPKRRKWDIKFW